MQVALCHVVLALHDPVAITRQKYSLALRHRFRFYYKRFCAFVVELLFKALRISWQNPCFRKEIVQFGHSFLHRCQISREQILSCQDIASWHVISSLIWFHLEQQRWQNRSIYPPYVPVFFLVCAKSESGLISAVLEDLVLSISNIYNERPIARLCQICISFSAFQVSCCIVQYVHLISILLRLTIR